MSADLRRTRLAVNTSTPFQAWPGIRSRRPPIFSVVIQHVEEAAHLRHLRSVLVRAPHVRLMQLGRLDERIAAQLDGIALAGIGGTDLAHQALERPGTGNVFVATVRAIEDGNPDRLATLLALADETPHARAGLLSALGWVSAASLPGITKALLGATQPWRREAALAACTMHAVDPGSSLSRALEDGDPGVRARALRAAGVCSRSDLVGSCVAALNDEDERCALEAARSALLLGERTQSLLCVEAWLARGAFKYPSGAGAFGAFLKSVPLKRVQAVLASLSKDPARMRAVTAGIGVAGDPHYVPWLIAQMGNPKLTRLAGEAFSFITGLNLPYLNLDRKPPEGMEFGPNEDPDDENVAMDEDESLPWPDPSKVADWWRLHGARFAPGTRYFMGQPPTRQSCLEVLKTGFQRQRIAAAEYLTLLSPGTPLFNTAAPTWRQQGLLAASG